MQISETDLAWRTVVFVLLISIMLLNAAVFMQSDRKRDRMISDLATLKVQAEQIRREYVLLRDYLVKQTEQDAKLAALETAIVNIKAEVAVLASTRKRD